MSISNHYPLFTKAHELRNYVQEIDRSLNLKYFSYAKFTPQGKALLLATNPLVFVHHIKQRYPLALLPAHLTQNESFLMTMITDNIPSIIQDEYQHFGHGCMIDYFKISENAIEMFCFVSGDNNNDQLNRFLNASAYLKSFAVNLSKDFISTISGDEMWSLPKSIQFNASCFADFNKQCPKYSKRELECLQLLASGKCIKEVAGFLQISVATAYDYVERAKVKSNCRTITELVAYFLSYYLNQ